MSTAVTTFKKATKSESKLRLGLIGPSGSGKTYTALSVATELGRKIALLDSEHGSASKYADIFSFDVLEPASFHPQSYIDAIRAAEIEGYDVLIIDSLSHAWIGKDGALDLVDRAAKKSAAGNSFAAWRDITPLHNALIDAMLSARIHIIATMRAKTEYVMDRDERTGKSMPRKVGLAPVQRDGMEYEFDIVGDLDQQNNFIVSKTRCDALQGQIIPKPGANLADIIRTWLRGAATAPDVTVSEITEIGVALYGAEHWHTKCSELCGALTKGGTNDLGSLTAVERARLAKALRERKPAAQSPQAQGVDESTGEILNASDDHETAGYEEPRDIYIGETRIVELGHETRLHFKGMPPAGAKEEMKRNGFRWNASDRYWHSTNGSALDIAQSIAEKVLVDTAPG